MASTVDARRSFEITSEEEAWHFLELVEAGEFGDEVIIPIFKGWPDSDITFWRDGEHETLTAPMMEALLDVQTSLYRSFMHVEEGTTNLRSLSNQQRRDYEVKFVVGKGCTKILPDWGEVAAKFAESAAKNMTGQQITIAIIVVVLSMDSTAAFRAWLSYKAKKAASESSNVGVRDLLAAQNYASDNDLKKWELMVGALERSTGTRALLDVTEEAHQGVLRAAARVDSTEVAGVEIQPGVAKRMARNGRAETEHETMEGRFKIIRVDADPEDGYRVRLEDVDTNLTFFANVRDALVSQEDRDILASAEWAKVPVFAKIATDVRRGEIVAAVITNVRKIEPN